MKITVTGATGFIGRRLVSQLEKNGHSVVSLARSTRPFSWDAAKEDPPAGAIEDVDAVIHLIGESLFGYWTKKRMRLIYDSRIESTHRLVRAISKLPQDKRPRVLICASATGYYGDKGEDPLSEEAGPGSGWLARLTADWEESARRAERLGLRVVMVRTAPVLGQGGILEILRPFFNLGVGAIFGSGRQWFPWISHRDIVRVYVHALENKKVSGPVNAASPTAVHQQEFMRILAKTMRRPLFLRLPAWLVRSVAGEMSQVILGSQKVIPEKLTKTGFSFADTNLQEVLTGALSPSSKEVQTSDDGRR